MNTPHAEPGSGFVTTVRQLGLMAQWQVRRMAEVLPLLVVVQLLLAVATIAGYSLLIGDLDTGQGLYLATGAPTVSLITVGLVMTPQMVTRARTEGSLDWLRTLPVAREVFLFADLAVWTVIALPGVVLGAIAGSVRFDADLRFTPMLVPVALLVSLTAAAVGYAIAILLAPQVAQLMSQVLVFIVLLFTPISFPPQNLPQWAQNIHDWFPLLPMAEAMRAGLAPHEFTVPTRSWVVLGVWCVGSVTAAGWALRRRG